MPRQPRKSDGQMFIELSRRIEVECFHIIGEVGFAQRRDELRAVVQLVAERGGQLTARELCEHLLAGKPPAVGTRLLAVCERMGLVEGGKRSPRGDAPFTLTEEGEQVVKGGDIFVPERGTWKVWVAKDPLIPPVERLLRVDPYREPPAVEELFGAGSKGRANETRRTVDLPDWVQEACDVSGMLAWGDGRAISMLDIEEQGEAAEPEADVLLTLRAVPGEPSSVRLDGTLQDRQAEYELEPEHFKTLGFEEVWRRCLGEHSHDWDGSRLAVRFQNLDDTERATFESHLGFPRWTHPDHGSFGPFQVPHVKLRPASDLDASLWANWLLEHQTQAYVRPVDFARRCEELQETFEGYRLQLMSQQQLAASVRQASAGRPDRTYWYLQAPLDWGL